MNHLSDYWESKWVRTGFFLFVFGSGPLLAIIAAAAIGLWPDPNPNPVGPGMLAGLTFWPAVICTAIGIGRVRARRRNSGG